ncbi:MAG: hypothetical protein DRZ90_12970 [Spirochaetes bacterium]|nr:MAG: hypothetical protein DRZ90_12970 [Spirochaetota bacterium]
MVSRAAGRQNKSAEIQKTESWHILIPLQPLKIPNWFIPDPIWGCFGFNSAPNGIFLGLFNPHSRDSKKISCLGPLTDI